MNTTRAMQLLTRAMLRASAEWQDFDLPHHGTVSIVRSASGGYLWALSSDLHQGRISRADLEAALLAHPEGSNAAYVVYRNNASQGWTYEVRKQDGSLVRHFGFSEFNALRLADHLNSKASTGSAA